MIAPPFTAEHDLFRKTLRDYVVRELAPHALEWDEAGIFPREVFRDLAQLGALGVNYPEEVGGSGGDFWHAVVLAEELVHSRNSGVNMAVLVQSQIATPIIQEIGTAEQKKEFLAPALAGEKIAALGISEPDAGSDVAHLRTTARRSGDDYVVNGAKTWITNARHADPLPVLVKTDPAAKPPHRGMSILMIEAGTPGLTVGKDLDKLGYKGTESAEVFLVDCRVPAQNLLGGVEGRGLQQALSALEFGRVNIAGRAVGVAQASLDRALAYAKERHAFGRPIGDFQAIQLKLADMATEVQAARLLTWWAAAALDSGRRADLETGMAKLFASEICIRASLEAMRIHGGYGYSTEYEVERFYRDAPLMAIGEGTNEILRTLIARQLMR